MLPLSAPRRYYLLFSSLSLCFAHFEKVSTLNNSLICSSAMRSVHGDTFLKQTPRKPWEEAGRVENYVLWWLGRWFWPRISPGPLPPVSPLSLPLLLLLQIRQILHIRLRVASAATRRANPTRQAAARERKWEGVGEMTGESANREA